MDCCGIILLHYVVSEALMPIDSTERRWRVLHFCLGPDKAWHSEMTLAYDNSITVYNICSLMSL